MDTCSVLGGGTLESVAGEWAGMGAVVRGACGAQ